MTYLHVHAAMFIPTITCAIVHTYTCTHMHVYIQSCYFCCTEDSKNYYFGSPCITTVDIHFHVTCNCAILCKLWIHVHVHVYTCLCDYRYTIMVSRLLLISSFLPPSPIFPLSSPPHFALPLFLLPTAPLTQEFSNESDDVHTPPPPKRSCTERCPACAHLHVHVHVGMVLCYIKVARFLSGI